MRIGTLVSNRELGRGLVIENTGAGWLQRPTWRVAVGRVTRVGPLAAGAAPLLCSVVHLVPFRDPVPSPRPSAPETRFFVEL